jgi:hypothetical protein
VLSEGGELISKSSRELLPLTLTIGLNNQTPTRAHWALHWISLGCVRRVSVGLVGTFSAGLHQGSERASEWRENCRRRSRRPGQLVAHAAACQLAFGNLYTPCGAALLENGAILAPYALPRRFKLFQPLGTRREFLPPLKVMSEKK